MALVAKISKESTSTNPDGTLLITTADVTVQVVRPILLADARKAIGRIVDVREGNKDGDDFFYCTVATENDGFEFSGNGRSPYKLGDEVTYVVIKPSECVPAGKRADLGPQGSGNIIECEDGSFAYHSNSPYPKVLGKGDMRAPSASRIAQERMTVVKELSEDIKEGASILGISPLDYARMIGLAD